PGVAASVSIYRLTGNGLQQIKNVPLGALLKAIAFDSIGHAWVVSTDISIPFYTDIKGNESDVLVGNSKVFQLDSNGNIINSYDGGGISGPWGLAIDGNDQVWIGNFEIENLPTKFSVSHLCGNQPATCPPGLNTGDPISPPIGYTLPSAGSQVLLANGQPLNGPNGPPSFEPLMRQTFVAIDAAGNVWVTNNWKPNPLAASTFNPGGDGVVAFVGMASPPQNTA
ncbi:hypothetical protein EP47_01345, partial [Legionella norrlandica]